MMVIDLIDLIVGNRKMAFQKTITFQRFKRQLYVGFSR